jgi:hypothetical protein
MKVLPARFSSLSQLATIVLSFGIAGVSLFAFHFQATTEPTTYRPAPQKKGREVNIRRGSMLLTLFLQQLADFTGENVYFQGEYSPELKIEIRRPITGALDEAAARVALEAQEFQLSRIEYKGRPVMWVQKALTRPKTKGRIIRHGDDPEEPPAPEIGSTKRAEDPGRTTTSGKATLLVREVGEGPRYMVSFETDSRKEAEDALKLLQNRVGKSE